MITVALIRKMIRDEDKISQSPKRNQLMATGAHPSMLENLETAETQIFMVLSHSYPDYYLTGTYGRKRHQHQWKDSQWEEGS